MKKYTRYEETFESDSEIDLKMLQKIKKLFITIFNKYKKYEVDSKGITSPQPRGVLIPSRSGKIFLRGNEYQRMYDYPQLVNIGIEVGSAIDRKISKKIKFELENGVKKIFDSFGFPYELSKDSWSGGNKVISQNRSEENGLVVSYTSFGGSNWTLYYITSNYKQKL